MKNGFWQQYKKLIKDVVLDYQYYVMLDEKDINIEREREDDSLPSGKSQAITNLKIAAGLEQGDHFGWWFQDTDVYKWIETAAYILERYDDPKLKVRVDEVIEIIRKAQDPSGYLSTFYQLRAPELMYKELDRSHELYNAGHLIEAAVAYTRVTGDTVLLGVAKRFVNHIQEHFGPGKIEGADGHQEIELALIKLYELTDDDQYLELSRYFIDIRGKNPEFYNQQKEQLGQEPTTNLYYLQAYTQPLLQKEAHGHAVRMLYMMGAMADLAFYQDDAGMESAVKRLFDDIITSKMYVTGGVGQTVQGEAFADRYELPNDTMYCETCAAIGMINTAKRLFRLDQNDDYIEVLERSLYNGMLAGMSQDGEHFFYVNPLEYIVNRNNPDKGHVKGQRPEWLGCACCPPNISRTIASVDSYFYSEIEDNLYVHMYADSSYESEFVKIQQTSDFPYEMGSQLLIEVKKKPMTFYFRKPMWAKDTTFSINGKEIIESITLDPGTYKGLVLIEAEPLAIYSSSNVVNNINKVAFQYGPFIYAGETVDQTNAIYKYMVDPTHIKKQWVEDSLANRYNLVVDASLKNTHQSLYSYVEEAHSDNQRVILIPYYLWSNRGLTDMVVWMNRKLDSK